MPESLKIKFIEDKIKNVTRSSVNNSILSSSPLSVSNLKTIKKTFCDVLVDQQKIGTISDFKVADIRTKDDTVMVDLTYKPVFPISSISTSFTLSGDWTLTEEKLTKEEKYERYIANKDW